MSANGKKRFPRRDALAVAAELCRQLSPVTVDGYLKVCGSLRRGKAEVGDIEIVFVPRTAERPIDLLYSARVDLAADAISDLVSSGVLAQRPNVNGIYAWGPQNKLAIHVASGVPVDFFSTTAERWPVTCVIRTGPKELNLRLIQSAAKRGLRLHAYGQGFTDTRTGEEIIPKTEREVFEIAGVPYLEAEQRKP